MKSINYYILAKVLAILIVMYVIIFRHKFLIKVMKKIIFKIVLFMKNNLIVEHNIIKLLIIGLLCLLTIKLIKTVFQKSINYFKFGEIKPRNTMSKGDAKWATLHDKKKGFLEQDYNHIKISGWIVDRKNVYCIYFFGKQFRFYRNYKPEKQSKKSDRKKIKKYSKENNE